MHNVNVFNKVKRRRSCFKNVNHVLANVVTSVAQNITE